MAWADKLDELRARPEGERQRLAIWGAILITLILFLLWLFNLRLVWQNKPAPAPAPRSELSGLAEWWREAVTRIQIGWQTIKQN